MSWCGWPWFDEGLPSLADWLVSLLSNSAKYCKYMKSRPFLLRKFNEVGKCDLLRLIGWGNSNEISKYQEDLRKIVTCITVSKVNATVKIYSFKKNKREQRMFKRSKDVSYSLSSTPNEAALIAKRLGNPQ